MKIFAIGMNYATHNQELHGTLKRPDERLRVGEQSSGMPVIFTKADSAILNQGKPFFIPDHLGRIDYETEVVVRICRLGKNIPERFAHRYYDAVTVGIDFTARDLQKKASEAGQPWTICKGFDGSAAIGEWVPKEKFLDIQELLLRHPLADGSRAVEALADGPGLACLRSLLLQVARREVDAHSHRIVIAMGKPLRDILP